MDEMSDGYKNTLSMIGDIAYRMAVLNPTLGNQVLEKTPGVVLIDEIENAGIDRKKALDLLVSSDKIVLIA